MANQSKSTSEMNQSPPFIQLRKDHCFSSEEDSWCLEPTSSTATAEDITILMAIGNLVCQAMALVAEVLQSDALDTTGQIFVKWSSLLSTELSDIHYETNTLHPKPLLLFKSCSEISLLHIWNVRDAATLLGALLCCTLVLLFPHHREIWTLQATNIMLGRECTTFPSSLFHISVSLLQCT